MILSLMACGGRDDFANSSIHWLDGQWVQNSGLRARYADYPTRLEFDGGTYAFVLTNYWAVASPGVAPRGWGLGIFRYNNSAHNQGIRPWGPPHMQGYDALNSLHLLSFRGTFSVENGEIEFVNFCGLYESVEFVYADGVLIFGDVEFVRE